MGFEVRIYVGKVGLYEDNNRAFFNTTAVVDLHNPGSFSEIGDLARSPRAGDKDVFLYTDFENNRTEEDEYGKPLRAIKIIEVLDAVYVDGRAGDYYPFEIAKAILDTAHQVNLSDKHDTLYAVLYGY